jgi:hypothetical protein
MFSTNIPWVTDFASWLAMQNMSKSNALSILRQVEKLANGDGVWYKNHWPKDAIFMKHQCITIHYDFAHLRTVAQRYEDTYGPDLRHGYLLRHPLKKLQLYQKYCGIQPTQKAHCQFPN